MGCLSSWHKEVGYVDSGRYITRCIEVAQYVHTQQNSIIYNRPCAADVRRLNFPYI